MIRITKYIALAVIACVANATTDIARGAAPSKPAPTHTVKLEVVPQTIRFTTPQQTMHVVVTGVAADGKLEDLTRAVQWKSLDPQVVRINEGLAIPAGNGKSEIEITYEGL